MKHNGKAIADFTSDELIQTYYYFKDMEDKRLEASKHEKFNKTSNASAMEFPPANNEFLKIYEALKEEIKSRNLTLWK